MGKSALEAPSLRWLPFGMPRLNPIFRDMVFFLYGKNPKTGDTVGPLGTGVLVSLPKSRGWSSRHVYAVTCHHCLKGEVSASMIRLNTKDGQSRILDFEPHEWTFLQDGHDLAAMDVTDHLALTDQYSVCPTSYWATKEFITQTEFGIGEDGFMLGLFAHRPGKAQNVVAARFGNVSLLAHDEEPVEHPKGIFRPYHLFDMHSRPGFSGSPVFAYRTPAGDLRTAVLRGADKPRQSGRRVYDRSDWRTDEAEFEYREASREAQERVREAIEARDNTFLVLLGIHVGQYPDVVTAKVIPRDAATETRLPVLDGDELSIPSSVTVVAPIWAVAELLDHQTFVQQRSAREAKDAQQRDNVGSGG